MACNWFSNTSIWSVSCCTLDSAFIILSSFNWISFCNEWTLADTAVNWFWRELFSDCLRWLHVCIIRIHSPTVFDPSPVTSARESSRFKALSLHLPNKLTDRSTDEDSPSRQHWWIVSHNWCSWTRIERDSDPADCCSCWARAKLSCNCWIFKSFDPISFCNIWTRSWSSPCTFSCDCSWVWSSVITLSFLFFSASNSWSRDTIVRWRVTSFSISCNWGRRATNSLRVASNWFACCSIRFWRVSWSFRARWELLWICSTASAAWAFATSRSCIRIGTWRSNSCFCWSNAAISWWHCVNSFCNSWILCSVWVWINWFCCRSFASSATLW